MTRMHFEALAAAIKGLDLSYSDREHVAKEVAKVCARFNSGFKKNYFIQAAGGFHSDYNE